MYMQIMRLDSVVEIIHKLIGPSHVKLVVLRMTVNSPAYFDFIVHQDPSHAV